MVQRVRKNQPVGNKQTKIAVKLEKRDQRWSKIRKSAISQQLWLSKAQELANVEI